ncbi:hypothetical protein [Devosia sp. RR2S18]|uniref:hypothetical protein n=1 Tax=Devosia rhizosphaerae TaxID=3049774 RepID=UPI00253F94C1|nr:hypothetical protein [Devosia sp. RR2S18]WIJ23938.1 hypothetical protein QOV41_12915 [Devosia sp. RR2S18]
MLTLLGSGLSVTALALTAPHEHLHAQYDVTKEALSGQHGAESSVSVSAGSLGIEPPSVFLWKDASGALKGVFMSQTQTAEIPLVAGDTIEVLATAGLNAYGPLLPSSEEVHELMQGLATDLLEQAKMQTCVMEPLPDTVTSTASVSFGDLASGSASLQATWRSEVLCADSR